MGSLLKKDPHLGFGVNSGFDTSRMVFQRKIVVEMSMRSLLCDMTFADICGLSVRMADKRKDLSQKGI